MANNENQSEGQSEQFSLWDNGTDETPRKIRTYTAADLAKPAPPLKFLIEGALQEKALGVTAGPQKSMKSWYEDYEACCLVTGKPLFGVFKVPRPIPVHFLVGEGGFEEFQRRIQLIFRSMGVSASDIADLPISSSHEQGPLNSELIRRHLDEVLLARPNTLIIVDSLYVYHPSDTQAGNLYDRGSELHRFSGPIVRNGGHVRLVDHTKKSPGGEGLDRIAYVGVQQWANNWLFIEDREPPDLELGKYWLRLELGGRTGIGEVFNVDMETGPFDRESGQYVGEFSVKYQSTNLPPKSVGRGLVTASDASSGKRSDRMIADDILARIGMHSKLLSQKSVIDGYTLLGLERIEGTRSRVRKVFAKLVADGRIGFEPKKLRGEDNKMYSSNACYLITPEPISLHFENDDDDDEGE